MTFKTWMGKFKKKNSDFGKLSKEVCSDQWFPSTGKLGKIIEYLFEKGERPEVVSMIYKGYIKYFKEKYVDDSEFL
jgi:hypothetical protein